MQFFEHLPKNEKFCGQSCLWRSVVAKVIIAPRHFKTYIRGCICSQRRLKVVIRVKGRVKKNTWTENRGHWSKRAALNPDCQPNAHHLLYMYLYSRKLPFSRSVKIVKIWGKISQEEWSKTSPTPNRKVSLNIKRYECNKSDAWLQLFGTNTKYKLSLKSICKKKLM